MRTPSDDWGPLPPHATVPRPRHGILKWLERTLLLVAVLSLGYYGWVTTESYLYQAYETRELDAILRSAPAPIASVQARERRPEPIAGSAIGRVEIPRLGVSAIVRAGSDARTLRLAVGHIPGTAYPGESGNVGLAGHRDTFFRKLREIRPDDVIQITTGEGTFRYRVERTTVVNPRDVWVLDATDHDVLTLITCYPFSYIGAAPQRFVVRAALAASPTIALTAR